MESIPSNPDMYDDSRRNRNLMLYIIGAVVLGCCCLVIGVGGYYGYKAYVTTRDAVQEVQEAFEFPVDPNDPNSPNVPIPFTPFSDAPEGGLGDERVRQFVWSQVFIYYQEANCPDPQIETTEITVIREPDANGSWQEEWNVDCGDGTYHAFIVDFMTQDGIASGLVRPPY